mmetsp:Transcript_16906/g.21391  ORF Transcript_16906/g.21391 Transcript_16906/m.21391 type:complete len:92 (-) Transcript_16906:273-548(-)
MPMENRNYLQQMTPAQLRIQADPHTDSSRGLGPQVPQSSINSMNPSQRLIQNQYAPQHQPSSLGQVATPSNFRNQYSQQALSYNKAQMHMA